MNGWGIFLFFIVMSVALIPILHLYKWFMRSLAKSFKLKTTDLDNFNEHTDKLYPIIVFFFGIASLIVYFYIKHPDSIDIPDLLVKLVIVVYAFIDNYSVRAMSKKQNKKFSLGYLFIRFIIFLVLGILSYEYIIKPLNLW